MTPPHTHKTQQGWKRERAKKGIEEDEGGRKRRRKERKENMYKANEL